MLWSSSAQQVIIDKPRKIRQVVCGIVDETTTSMMTSTGSATTTRQSAAYLNDL
jgi:hypothetical protein